MEVKARLGEVVSEMRADVESITKASTQPVDTTLIIIGGVHSIEKSQDLINDLVLMKARESPSLRIVVSTLTPWNGYAGVPAWTPVLQRDTETVNDRIRRLDGYIDAYDTLADTSGKIKSAYAPADGDHIALNEKGNQALAKQVADVLGC